MHNLQLKLSCFHLIWPPDFLTGSVKHNSELYLFDLHSALRDLYIFAVRIVAYSFYSKRE